MRMASSPELEGLPCRSPAPLLVDGGCHERHGVAGAALDRHTGDDSSVVDVVRVQEMALVARSQSVQVDDSAALPQDGGKASAPSRQADDLGRGIDTERLPVLVARKGAEVLQSPARTPHEGSLVEGAPGCARRVGEADHHTALTDRHWRIPGFASEATQVGRDAGVPHDHVPRGEAAYCLVADPRDPDDLAAIVDGGGSAGPVALPP